MDFNFSDNYRATVPKRNLPAHEMTPAVFPGDTGRFYLITYLSRGEIHECVTVQVESKDEISSYYGMNARILAGPFPTKTESADWESVARERNRRWDAINPLRYIEPSQIAYAATMGKTIERETVKAVEREEKYANFTLDDCDF